MLNSSKKLEATWKINLCSSGKHKSCSGETHLAERLFLSDRKRGAKDKPHITRIRPHFKTTA